MEPANKIAKTSFQLPPLSGLFTMGLLACALMLFILPTPPFVVDFLLTLNFSLAVLILCIGVHVRPVDQRIVPGCMLLLSLLRIGLSMVVLCLLVYQGGVAGQVVYFYKSLLFNIPHLGISLVVMFLLGEAFCQLGISFSDKRLPGFKAAFKILRIELFLLFLLSVILVALYTEVFPKTMQHLYRPPLLPPNVFVIVGSLFISQMVPLFLTILGVLWGSFAPGQEPHRERTPFDDRGVSGYIQKEVQAYPYASLYAGAILLLIAITSPFTGLPWWTFLIMAQVLLMGAGFVFIQQDVELMLVEKDRQQNLLDEKVPQSLEELSSGDESETDG